MARHAEDIDTKVRVAAVFSEGAAPLGSLVFLLLLLGPKCANACSVCFGDPESLQGRAMKAGILVLLGFICTVLSGFAGLFLYWMSRSRRLAATEEQNVAVS